MFAELNLSFRHCVGNIILLLCATYCSDSLIQPGEVGPIRQMRKLRYMIDCDHMASK